MGEFRAKNQAEIAVVKNLANLAIKDMEEKGKREQQKIVEEKKKDNLELQHAYSLQDLVLTKK
jgi:hypothetical protein